MSQRVEQNGITVGGRQTGSLQVLMVPVGAGLQPNRMFGMPLIKNLAGALLKGKLVFGMHPANFDTTMALL